MMDSFVHICDAINKSLDHIESEKNGSLGIPSGFPSLDILTFGWHPGEMIIIGARPCVGKTAFALSLSRNAAVDFHVPTVYFSLKLSTTDITDRLIVAESNLSIEQIHGRRNIENHEWTYMETCLSKLAKAPLYLDDTPGLTITQLRSSIQELASRFHIRLVCIDHLHLILPDGKLDCYSSRQQEEEYILAELKKLAIEFGISIVVLTYIKRPTRRNYMGPILADLDAYCPAADYYADKIILLQRSSLMHMTEKSDDSLDPVEAWLVHNKNGRTGRIDLMLNTEKLRIEEQQ